MGAFVPVLIFLGVLQPEVSTRVHHAHALLEQRDHGFSAGFVRKGAEYKVDICRFRFNSEVQLRKVREYFSDLFPYLASAGDRTYFYVGMPDQYSGQVCSNVSGHVNYRHSYASHRQSPHHYLLWEYWLLYHPRVVVLVFRAAPAPA